MRQHGKNNHAVLFFIKELVKGSNEDVAQMQDPMNGRARETLAGTLAEVLNMELAKAVATTT